ncbi:TPA: hypothetical protein JD342_10940 [Citrobacter freundii]|nr:hypothetical protein [Citrobacter freundii]
MAAKTPYPAYRTHICRPDKRSAIRHFRLLRFSSRCRLLAYRTRICRPDKRSAIRHFDYCALAVAGCWPAAGSSWNTTST